MSFPASSYFADLLQVKKSSQTENFLEKKLIFAMRVHLIRRETIEAFTQQNAQSSAAFDAWCNKLKCADWEIPANMQATFPSADLLGNGSSRIVFDIAGNKYRMIGKYAFGDKQVHLFICWIGTHAEYDKLCNAGEQYNVSDY